jgi:predicted DNA-binding transcriptional regulator AlpA
MTLIVSNASARSTVAIDPGARCLSARKAAAYLGLGYSTLFELRKKDPSFPAPVRLSANRVVYLREEIDAYIEAKRAAVTTLH